jgi:hypothetical protein
VVAHLELELGEKIDILDEHLVRGETDMDGKLARGSCCLLLESRSLILGTHVQQGRQRGCMLSESWNRKRLKQELQGEHAQPAIKMS